MPPKPRKSLNTGPPTEDEFFAALNRIALPGGSQRKFLRAHRDAPGRAATAKRLAEAAGYKDHRGVNLHYGRLAKRIGRELGRSEARLSLLVDFAPPRSLTNREWVLVMHPQFAKALKRARWV